MTGAGPALLDVLADQLAGLPGELTIPVGQQRTERRTVLPPGVRDEQHPEVLLQVAASA